MWLWCYLLERDSSVMSSPGKGWPVLVNCFGTTLEIGQSNDNWELFQDHYFVSQSSGGELRGQSFSGTIVFKITPYEWELAPPAACYLPFWWPYSHYADWFLVPWKVDCSPYHSVCCTMCSAVKDGLYSGYSVYYTMCSAVKDWIVALVTVFITLCVLLWKMDCSPGHSVHYIVCPAVKDGL